MAEVNMQKAQEVFDALVNMLDTRDWKYEKFEEDLVIKAGIKGIWNFANMEIKLDTPGVIVENIHLGDSLMALCYEIKTKNSSGDENV